MSLKVDFKTEDEQLIVRLSGKMIEAYEGKEILQAFDNHLSDGNNHVIADLSDVPHMNSSGLNLMVRILTHTRNNKGELVITGLSEKVRELYIMTKLNAIFKIAENMDEARKMLSEITKNSQN